MSVSNEKEVLFSIIKRRKSVRSYVRDKEVSKEDLVDLVKAGMAAPTSKNSQPWEFIVINEKAVIDNIIQAVPAFDMLADAGAGIIIAGNTYRALKEVSEIWIQDCSAAAENILLAAEAMNLGACWCMIHPVDARISAMREVLGLPEFCIPLNLITIGHSTGYEVPQDKWNRRRMHWNRWSF